MSAYSFENKKSIPVRFLSFHFAVGKMKTAIMDSWYATQRLMAAIDNFGKIYYCPLKSNHLVDDSAGVDKYKRIDQLTWSEKELLQGKLLKIHKFPKDKKVKLFWVTVSPNRTEYVITNDLTQDYTPEVHAICSIRWIIEEFHREIKQLMGIEALNLEFSVITLLVPCLFGIILNV